MRDLLPLEQEPGPIQNVLLLHVGRVDHGRRWDQYCAVAWKGVAVSLARGACSCHCAEAFADAL